MKKEINRRDFFQKSAAIGVTSVVGSSMTKNLENEAPELVAVKGQDYFKNTKKAVEILGGIERYVPKHSKVALLPNAQSNNPGTFTKPEIVRAVIQMCKEAGAKEIACIGWLPKRHWQNTRIKKVIDEEGAELVITDLRDKSLFKTVPVPKGVVLKEAQIMKSFYEYDILINMNITKEHSGSNLSGALKNLMGINSPKSNQTFHKVEGKLTKEGIRYLDQCIADLNTIFPPHLCVIDATEFVITNGPNGPGELLKPQKVVAGTDRVAIDTYCSNFFGYNPKNIHVLVKAQEQGIGEMDLKNVNIQELKI